MATLRGDGYKLPGMFIIQQSHTARKSSERYVPKDVTPRKGMNKETMFDYIDEVARHVHKHSILLMDQAAHHTSGEVIDYIRAKMLLDGSTMFKPYLLPAKSSFLISPCDNSFFATFKRNFHTKSRDTLNKKRLHSPLTKRSTA